MGTRYEDVISRLSRERAMTVASIDTPPPDRAAAANRAARDTGVPAETADRNLDRLQRMNETRRMERLIDRNPELARPLGDPRVTAVARDDADGIARVARAFDPEEWARKYGTLKAAPEAEATLWGGVKGVWRSLMGSGAQVESNLLLMMSDWIGGTPSFVNSPTNDRATTESQLRRIAREEARIDAARPQYQSVAARGVYGGFESAARMAPGLAASIATRNPYPALIAAGVGSGVPAYGKYRNRGGTRGEALLGASLEGGIEVVTEKLPMGYLVENFGRVGFNKFLREYMGRELPSEQLATLAQDAVDTAIANPDKTWGDYWKERPNAQLETAIATLTMSAIGASASAVVDRSTRDAVRAEADAEFLDELAGQAAQSKTRQRDPEAFAALVGALRGEAGDSVFVPGEVVRQYLQSDTLHDRDFWDEYRDQVEEAVATGGDVVLPVDRAVAHLSGTKAWETLKDDMRLSPGGMSLREAADFDGAYSGTIEASAQEATQRIEADRVAAEPRQRLFDDAYAKLTNAGYTPDAARLQAELVAQRYATRAARLGTELTGNEFQTIAINQVMPEGLAPLRSADNVDMVIAALRRSRDPNAGTKRQSLLEFIASRGGLLDAGGDLTAMGADRWHRDKRFRKRLMREGSGDADMLGDSAAAQYGLDATLEAAIEAGYFPDLNFTRGTAGDFTAADAPDNRVLLQAIDDELRGQPTYAEDAVPEAMRAVADDLARALDQAGIDPETADDNTIRSFLQRFGDATADGQQYDQSYMDGPRGRVTFAAGRATIDLFEKRDLSTFIHETGHVWLEELKADALAAMETEGAEAARQTFADWETVKAWFARNGHAVAEDGTIPVDAHEMWARGVERYLMEGKAPTAALRRAFDTFKSWLLTIYQVVDNLRSPITDDIRDVMDRLLATDAEISAARSEQGIGLLFADAQAAGMTDAEYRAYSATAEEARTEARDALLYKTMASVRAKRTKEYKEQRAGVREDIAAQVDSRREFQALAMVRSEMRLDRDAITAAYGADALDLLPAGVPPVYRENGASPDAVAERVGYQTGDEMVRALMGIEARRKAMRAADDKRTVRNSVIDEETDAVMADRYGDPLADGTIEREARELIHSDMQGDVIAAELRALSRMRPARSAPSQAPTPYQAARRWAERKVAEGEVREYSSRGAIARYQRTARKAAREAEQAIIAGDIDTAFRAKQVQLLNNALISESTKAADAIESAVSRMTKVAKRRTLKSVDQDYLEQAQSLLEAVELRERSQVSIDRQQSFLEWAASRPEGEEVFIPPRFSETGTHYSRMSVEALLGLDDTVKSIIHLGRIKQTLLDNQERREFNDWKSEALESLEATPGRKITNELGDPSRPIAGIFSNLMKMEVFAAEMDNDRANGAWTRLMVNRASEVANSRDEMRDRSLNPIAEAYNQLDAAARNRLAEKITMPEIVFRSADEADPRNGSPMIMTRWDVVGMALNLGTASNLDKLARGYRVDPAVIEQRVMSELTAQEWAFVQSVWTSLETIWPDVAASEREMSGVEPERVEPRQVETPHGVLTGGYYPLVYDPRFAQRAEDNAGQEASDLFGKRTGVATAKGHTVSRTNYAAPLLLSPEQVLFSHVEKVITRAAYAPWVRDVLKAVKDPAVRSAIDRKFGPEFRQQIEPWLRQQVRENAGNETGTRFAERFLRSARVNLTVVAMGLRWSTGVAQTVGLANSIGRIGPNNLRKGAQQLLRNPAAAAEFAFARSPEMLRRNEAMNRDTAEAFRQMRRARLGGNAAMRTASAWQAKAQAFAFWHIGVIDRYVVALPTWLGAYQKGVGEGMDDPAASAYADKMVRLSQGSGREKDLAAWQSNQASEGLKFFTMFYTPFNVLLNAQWETGRAVRRGDYRKAAMLGFWFLIATPLLDAFITGDSPDEDDEEGWAKWFARNVGTYQLAGIPLARDAGNYVERKMIGEYATFSPGPIGRIFQASEAAVNLAWDSTFGEDEVSDRWLRTAIETPGYFLGLPTGQVAATMQFLSDVADGDADPQSFADWYQGLTKGKLNDPG